MSVVKIGTLKDVLKWREQNEILAVFYAFLNSGLDRKIRTVYTYEWAGIA